MPQGPLTRLGFRFLNLTTRSWTGFWGTVILCVIYVAYNSLTHGHLAFDPFPYVLLCVILTVFSYFQNIIIMTMQRADENLQTFTEEHDKIVLQHIHDVVQALHAMMQVQLGQDAKIQALLSGMTKDLEEIQKDLTEDL